ncbi:hypothetical protein CEXT_654331 [Caerostris extrusa]|uniref:Uncharacterized protein n=1 Tax=Caerostris extrusa TaxID=172846 RepID=A0AAV4NBZ6_CAEEX|nr:hypothetical protein CEXT_654331 [Caerostris extrusa]
MVNDLKHHARKTLSGSTVADGIASRHSGKVMEISQRLPLLMKLIRSRELGGRTQSLETLQLSTFYKTTTSRKDEVIRNGLPCQMPYTGFKPLPLPMVQPG